MSNQDTSTQDTTNPEQNPQETAITELQALTESEVEEIAKRYTTPRDSVDELIKEIATGEYRTATAMHFVAAVAIQAAAKTAIAIGEREQLLDTAAKSQGLTYEPVRLEPRDVMWCIVNYVLGIAGPAKIVAVDGMLNPKNFKQFDQVISKEDWAFLQERAKEILDSAQALEATHYDHLKSIVKGNPPFNYVVET